MFTKEDHNKSENLLLEKIEKLDLEQRQKSREKYFSQRRFWLLHQESPPQINEDTKLTQKFEKITLEENHTKSKELAKKSSRRHFAQMFQQPTYIKNLVGIDDFKYYYFCVIPAGNRCFVSSENGKTSARSSNGNYIKHFSSLLPGGHKSQTLDKYSCILDCILSGVWNEWELYNQEAELRFFWVHSNISRQMQQLMVVSELNEYAFQFIQLYELKSQNEIIALTKQEFPYIKQGMMIIDKSAYYTQGVNPEIYIVKNEDLKWNYKEVLMKIRQTVGKIVQAFYRVNQLGEIFSLENKKLGILDDQTQIDSKLKWQIFEFKVEEIIFEKNEFKSMKFTLVGPSNRVLEDSLSKTYFWLNAE